MDIIKEVATKAGISEAQAMLASEVLREVLHRRLVEYDGDYFGAEARWELSDRGFYHLLGFVEQLSSRYSWDEGSISEYLGRMPPVERWEALADETANWKWRDK